MPMSRWVAQSGPSVGRLGGREVMEGGDETNHRQQHSFGEGRNSAAAAKARHATAAPRKKKARERGLGRGREGARRAFASNPFSYILEKNISWILHQHILRYFSRPRPSYESHCIL